MAEHGIGDRVAAAGAAPRERQNVVVECDGSLGGVEVAHQLFGVLDDVPLKVAAQTECGQ